MAQRHKFPAHGRLVSRRLPPPAQVRPRGHGHSARTPLHREYRRSAHRVIPRPPRARARSIHLDAQRQAGGHPLAVSLRGTSPPRARHGHSARAGDSLQAEPERAIVAYLTRPEIDALLRPHPSRSTPIGRRDRALLLSGRSDGLAGVRACWSATFRPRARSGCPMCAAPGRAARSAPPHCWPTPWPCCAIGWTKRIGAPDDPVFAGTRAASSSAEAPSHRLVSAPCPHRG